MLQSRCWRDSRVELARFSIVLVRSKCLTMCSIWCCFMLIKVNEMKGKKERKKELVEESFEPCFWVGILGLQLANQEIHCRVKYLTVNGTKD